jgi:ADP-ribose pyrophosphatase YjhB (NUDIX family)
MDYISELRQYVGHRPLLMVGAAVLIVDSEDRLLLMKRSDSSCWGPPGGAVELGEVVEEAACREVREETGLELEELELFGVFSGPDLFYRYPNGDEVYNVTIVYLAHEPRGDIGLNSEHVEWNWFKVADLPLNISPPIKPVVEQLVKDIYGSSRCLED